MECACDQACGQSRYGEDNDYEKNGRGAQSRVLAVRHAHNLTVPEPDTGLHMPYTGAAQIDAFVRHSRFSRPLIWTANVDLILKKIARL